MTISMATLSVPLMPNLASETFQKARRAKETRESKTRGRYFCGTLRPTMPDNRERENHAVVRRMVMISMVAI